MLTHLLKFSLSQRFLVVVLALTLAAAGLYSYRRLPIDAFPDISNTQVQVIVTAPGMTPLEVEQRITHPIEVEVRGIQNQVFLLFHFKVVGQSIRHCSRSFSVDST